ncbi:hypothetical protein [Williamsia phyllosphaerae]|uniref:Uncharacterized protein n=1 Tax=Williamsia phyllosphaerae TaxID=885042 RepID=A0ABQ1V0S6_9NOCA|nr:hypothetical protein [Williamsia phyllosphaerae]GGF32913.1 hypothetical protein GCM10007298_31000 [Williamsia phyllosphaerae]
MSRIRLPLSLRVLVTAAATVVSITAAAGVASADANATPDYEVKLDLLASSLDSSGVPSAAVRSAFGLSSTASSRSYEYFDTSSGALGAQGWSVRLRHKTGKNLELNYKKRFDVSNDDVTSALDTANRAGFDSSDTNYDAQVDWGYSRQELSFSNDKSASGSNYSGTSLPAVSTARSLLVTNIPGKLDDWTGKHWGTDRLTESAAHGPVTTKVYSGSWQGTEPSIEVLTVPAASGSGTQTVIELSFTADTRSEAAGLRAKAISLTDSNAWLYHGDILKTELILDRL